MCSGRIFFGLLTFIILRTSITLHTLCVLLKNWAQHEVLRGCVKRGLLNVTRCVLGEKHIQKKTFTFRLAFPAHIFRSHTLVRDEKSRNVKCLEVLLHHHPPSHKETIQSYYTNWFETGPKQRPLCILRSKSYLFLHLYIY